MQGVRISRKTDDFFKKFSARLFYWLIRALVSDKFLKDAADFRVISSYCRELLLSIDAPLPLRFTLNSLAVEGRVYEFEVKKRFAGESKYSISKMTSLAISSVITVSQRPLKNIAGLGIGVSFLSSLILALIVVSEILGKTVSGWASLATLIAFGSKGLSANHLPFIVDYNKHGSTTLLGHIALENQLFKENKNNI